MRRDVNPTTQITSLTRGTQQLKRRKSCLTLLEHAVLAMRPPAPSLLSVYIMCCMRWCSAHVTGSGAGAAAAPCALWRGASARSACALEVSCSRTALGSIAPPESPCAVATARADPELMSFHVIRSTSRSHSDHCASTSPMLFRTTRHIMFET